MLLDVSHDVVPAMDRHWRPIARSAECDDRIRGHGAGLEELHGTALQPSDQTGAVCAVADGQPLGKAERAQMALFRSRIDSSLPSLMTHPRKRFGAVILPRPYLMPRPP